MEKELLLYATLFEVNGSVIVILPYVVPVTAFATCVTVMFLLEAFVYPIDGLPVLSLAVIVILLAEPTVAPRLAAVRFTYEVIGEDEPVVTAVLPVRPAKVKPVTVPEDSDAVPYNLLPELNE